MSKDLKLLTCPFCGGTPHIVDGMKRNGMVYVQCDGCCRTSYRRNAKEAAEAWNRRQDMKLFEVM